MATKKFLISHPARPERSGIIMNERKNFWWALLDPFSAYYDKTIFLPGSNLESVESKEERERERNSENKIKTHRQINRTKRGYGSLRVSGIG